MLRRTTRAGKICRQLGIVNPKVPSRPKTPRFYFDVSRIPETCKSPRPDRRDEIALWEERAERSFGLTVSLEERARQIVQQGIAVLDSGGGDRRCRDPIELR